MAQIDKVRLPDGRTVRPTEWSSTPLYSTVDITTGALTTLQGFSYSKGGEVPGSVGPRKSTLCDTNMRGSGGEIPENEELLLYSIMVEVFMSVRTPGNYYAGGEPQPDAPLVSALNVLRFQRDTILALRIASTKDYYAHPVGFFPGAMGVELYLGNALCDNPNSAHQTIMVGSNGSVNSYDNREIGTPHQVGAGEAFEIALEFPFGQINALNFGTDANARLQARIYADGYRRRPVA